VNLELPVAELLESLIIPVFNRAKDLEQHLHVLAFDLRFVLGNDRLRCPFVLDLTPRILRLCEGSDDPHGQHQQPSARDFARVWHDKIPQFTVLEGELTVKRGEQISILHQGETAVIEPGIWHDWWNAGDRAARVRVEITPGERFVHMIETFFGLARLGHTDGKGMPHPLQLALSALEFSDVIVFRSPPLALQRAIFGALAPIAYWRGYRATYPQLSRIMLAPRA
jgi:Cupin domain